MTEAFFLSQIDRLKIRFGEKAFDREFVRILGKEIAVVPDEFFRQRVDMWIGTRKNNNPPLVTDFKDCRLAFEKSKFNVVVKEASQSFSYGLKDVLKKHYNVDSLKEAMELEKLKIKLGGADGQGGFE